MVFDIGYWVIHPVLHDGFHYDVYGTHLLGMGDIDIYHATTGEETCTIWDYIHSGRGARRGGTRGRREHISGADRGVSVNVREDVGKTRREDAGCREEDVGCAWGVHE